MATYTLTGFYAQGIWDGTLFSNPDYRLTIEVTDDDANADNANGIITDTTESVTITEATGSLASLAGTTFTNDMSFTVDITFQNPDGQTYTETFYYLGSIDNVDTEMYVAGVDSMLQPGATFISDTNYVAGPWPYSAVACFTTGALIETAHGPVAVEDLRAGDMILTADGSHKPLRKVLSTQVNDKALRANDKLLPVRICAGSLGRNLPSRDLVVSRQHRMLISSRIAERMFGEPEVLVAAIRLTEVPGIYVDTETEEVTYFHLLFDTHEIIYAEGYPTESLYLGAEALKTMKPDLKREIVTLFPELAAKSLCPEQADRRMAPARLIPENRLQRHLINRHVKNQKPMLSAM